jgi:N6-L-threonylcarbamoyladenine synthase
MRPLVLALDTATEVTCVGLARWPGGAPGAPEVLAELNVRAPRAALSNLLPAVRELMSEARLVPAEIDAVVCGRGPGSYTGVRIGMATAKGLAHGLRVPLLGVGTLDAVAAGFVGESCALGVVGDAMRGEVYPARFDVAEDGFARLGMDEVAAPEEVAGRWAAEVEEHHLDSLVIAGDGLVKHAAVFEEALGGRALLAPEDRWWPTGRSLLGAAFFEHGRAVGAPARGRKDGSGTGGTARSEAGEHDAGQLLPVYTNLSDAERFEGRTHVPRSGVTGPGDDGGEPAP